MYYALAPSPIPCSPGLADGLPQAPLRAARPLRCGRPFPQALCRRPPRPTLLITDCTTHV